MKASCTQENLQRGLAIVSRASTKNVNLPILNNVYIEADASGIQLVTTNLELAISCSIRGKVDQQGSYTVPSKLFFDVVSLLPNDRVDLDLYDDTLFIASKKTKTKMKGMPSADYPLVPPVEGGVTFGLSITALKEALSQVIFASATNESRPELAGVYIAFNHLEEGEGSVVFAATDSYRLSEVVSRVSSGPKEPISVIAPSRTLAEVLRIISMYQDEPDAPPTVDLHLGEGQMVFSYANIKVTSRTIEGQYPNYRQILPKDKKTEILLSKKDFAQAIKTSSLFSRNGLNDVAIKIRESLDGIDLQGADAARGENTIGIDGPVDGEAKNIVLNYRYLLDGVNAIDAEELVLGVLDKDRPCTLVPRVMPEDRRQIYLIMPIRQ